MSKCCTTDQSIDPTACPSCGFTGPVVGALPVRSHLAEAIEGSWQHCPTPDCAVIYYLDNHTIIADDVRTQVGHKASEKPTPICFCFSHTADDLADDLQANDGVSTIKADIKTAVANGFCACEHLNVSGNCCLADVHRTLNTITTAATTRDGARERVGSRAP